MRNRLVLAVLAGALTTSSLLGADMKPVAAKPKVVVFSGDNVFPHVVDGGLWKTTFKFVNLENHTVTFTLSFFDDNGNPLELPILANSVLSGGYFTSIAFSLPTATSTTLETAGTA